MISIIIVSYNRLDLVKKCLAATIKTPDSEIILVDNNSSEDIIGYTKKTYPKIKIIANKTNTGFAIGNNQGMKAATGDYFLLVNTDAFVEKNTAEKLVKFAKLHPDCGAVGPKLLNADGSLQPSAGNFPFLLNTALMMLTLDNWPVLKELLPSIHPRSQKTFSRPRTFGWVTGACLLVPKDVFLKTKGFNDHYFLYGEELEWQYRMSQMGLKSYYVPNAVSTHLGYSSSSQANGAIKELLSIIEFNKKYSPAWQIPILKAIIVIGCLLRICRGLVQPKNRWMVKGYLSAIYKIYES